MTPLLSQQEIVERDGDVLLVERRAVGRARLQPRFDVQRDLNGSTGLSFFNSFIKFARHIDDEPEYSVKSNARDKWLLKLTRLGTLIDGIIFSMAQRDASRGYSLVGPVSTIQRVRNMFVTADRGSGWREHVFRLATSFYATDMGAVPQWYYGTENNRPLRVTVEDDGDVMRPPLQGIFYYDPTKLELTGNWQKPLIYRPANPPEDFDGVIVYGEHGRFCSMPSVEEEYHGLGWCFMSRAVQVIRMLLTAFNGYEELMSSRAPQGFLLLSGLTRQQLEEAAGGYETLMDQFKRQHFGATMILANDSGVPVDGKYLPVAQFPEGFDLKGFVDLMMLGLALAAGLPVSDLWDVSTGRGFGREGENRESFRRAASKGRNAFALAHQDELQKVLPASVHFEYERHNADERIIEAAAVKAWLEVGEIAQRLGVDTATNLSYMVNVGALPPEVTEAVESSTTSDTGNLQETRAKKRLLEHPDVYEAILYARQKDSREPIGRLTYREDLDGTTCQRLQILWHSAHDALRRTTYPAATVRQSQEEIDELYRGALEQLASDIREEIVTRSEGEGLLAVFALAALVLRWMHETGDTDQEVHDAAVEILDTNLVGDEEERLLQDYLLNLEVEAQALIEEELEGVARSPFVDDAAEDDISASRLALWTAGLAVVSAVALLARNRNEYFQWKRSDAKDSCTDCLRLHNQVHTAQEWLDSGWFPQKRSLLCMGYHCGCKLVEAEGPSEGDF